MEYVKEIKMKSISLKKMNLKIDLKV